MKIPYSLNKNSIIIIKITPISKYQHEYEPVGLMLITNIVMQYKALCLLWEVGSKGVYKLSHAIGVG
jgi:hypothetical protein